MRDADSTTAGSVVSRVPLGYPKQQSPVGPCSRVMAESWDDLFDRAGDYDVDEARIREALERVREGSDD